MDDEQRDGEQRGIFEQRDPPRGIDQPLIHQARAEIEKQASEDEFGDVGDEARIDREHQDRSSSDGEPANRAAAACGVYQRCPAKRNAAHIAADQPGHRVRRAKRLELSAKLRLAARGKLDSCGIEQHGDGSHEHHGKNVAAQARQDAPWELSDVAKVPCRREPNRGWSLERPAKPERFAEARSGEGEHNMGEDRRGEENAGKQEGIFSPAHSQIKPDRNSAGGRELTDCRLLEQGWSSP